MDPRLQRLFQGLGGPGGGGAAMPEGPLVDTAEKVHISSLALLKMLKHGIQIYAKIAYLWKLFNNLSI